MFEIYFLNLERKVNYYKIFIFTVFISLVIGGLNYFIGGDYFFLIALVSLFLTYPVVSFLLKEEKIEFEKKISEKNIIKRHEKEMFIVLTIFLAVLLSFIIISPLVKDYSFTEKTYNYITGHIIFNSDFFTVLTNNLVVLFFTFLASLVSLSGLIFIIVWNASLVAYYFTTFLSFKDGIIGVFGVLGHGIIEVLGYILIGLAGGLLSYRLSKKKLNNYYINKRFIYDFSILIVASIIFIFISAFLEVL
ncbi:MAG: hypothetical protein PHT94_00535 [Candidatus Nanoarchaeia archaeon]|nr:hypothetical protein [Candidatus Nanoarchaeia archaeon]